MVRGIEGTKISRNKNDRQYFFNRVENISSTNGREDDRYIRARFLEMTTSGVLGAARSEDLGSIHKCSRAHSEPNPLNKILAVKLLQAG
jgi:hypothetical protein